MKPMLSLKYFRALTLSLALTTVLGLGLVATSAATHRQDAVSSLPALQVAGGRDGVEGHPPPPPPGGKGRKPSSTVRVADDGVETHGKGGGGGKGHGRFLA